MSCELKCFGIAAEAAGEVGGGEFDEGGAAAGAGEGLLGEEEALGEGADFVVGGLVAEAEGAGGGEAGDVFVAEGVGVAAFAGEFGEVAEKRFGAGGVEPVGDGFEAVEVAAKFLEGEAVAVEPGLVFGEGGGEEGFEFEGDGEEEALADGLGGGEAGLKVFEPDAFVGGAGVEEDEAGGGFEEVDVAAPAANEAPGEAEKRGGDGGD